MNALVISWLAVPHSLTTKELWKCHTKFPPGTQCLPRRFWSRHATCCWRGVIADFESTVCLPFFPFDFLGVVSVERLQCYSRLDIDTIGSKAQIVRRRYLKITARHQKARIARDLYRMINVHNAGWPMCLAWERSSQAQSPSRLHSLWSMVSHRRIWLCFFGSCVRKV